MKKVLILFISSTSVLIASNPAAFDTKSSNEPYAHVMSYKVKEKSNALMWRVFFRSGPLKNIAVYEDPTATLTASLRSGDVLSTVSKIPISVTAELRSAFYEEKAKVNSAAAKSSLSTISQAAWQTYPDNSVELFWHQDNEK